MNFSSSTLARTCGRLPATAIRYGIAATAVLVLSAASTTIAQAQVSPSPPLEASLPAPPPVKKYKVEMVDFKCLDESGNDWPFSDEPYWVISSVGLDGTSTTRRSVEFSDVDSGESRTFAAGDRAVFPQPSGSASAPNGIGVSIQLWEADGGNKAGTVSTTSNYFKAAGAISSVTPAPAWVPIALGSIGTATSLIGEWWADDFMGSNTFAYTQKYLDDHVPAVGDTHYELRDFHNGPDYRLKLKITRTA
jgi:hypothetical protein